MTQWSLLGPFFQRHTVRIFLTCVVGILSSMATILLPVSIGKFYALVFSFEGQSAMLLDFLPAHYCDTVPHFLGLFAVFIGLYAVTHYGKRYLTASAGELWIYELRNQLFKHQLKLNTRVYEEKGVGKYLLRYSGDLKSIQNYLTKGIIGFTSDIVLIVCFIWVLATVSYLLTFISLLAMGLMLVPISLLNQRLHTISLDRRNQKSGLLSFVSQRLQAIVTIKAFNRAQPEGNQFENRSRKVFQTGCAFHRLSSFIFVLIPTLLYAMIGVIMYAIHLQKAAGVVIDQASLLSAFLLILTMLPVFRRSLRITVVWKLGLISIEKLQHVLDLPLEQVGGKDDLIKGEGTIEIQDLSFGYGKTKILDQLSVQWASHGLHLVIGGTGSGKSLLAKLLLGVYNDYKGRIIVNEQDIREANIKSLRKQVTIVSDDYPLLGKTVFEAISYSRKDSKRKAAEIQLNKVQHGLPEEAKISLDQRIGSQGNNLSKGQESVLLFTRALLTRKPILLLDEPFRSIEPQMKIHLIRLIKRLKRKRTIILLLNHHDLQDLEFDSVTDLDAHRAAPAGIVKKLRKAKA
ncbi:MAG: ABC transporter ATP-binding protein [Bacteroidota bacterium]